MKSLTIADVAKHANVSKSTVSQFLNKRFDYMSDETKTRIEKAIEELGYQPNIVARSLKQKTTSTIGVIVANILHTFSTQVLRAIEDFFHDSDIHVIICNADDDPNKEKRYIEMLRAKQVDGIIIFPTGDNIDLYEKMKEDKFPIVFVDRMIAGMTIPSVVLDNKKAAKLGVEYFVKKGYGRIGIITTSILRNLSSRIDRIKGYKEALIENGIAENPSYIKSVELNQIQESLDEMLSLNDPPQAILAGNDLALIEILKYVKEKDLTIPSDLSVIGIDEVSFASFFSPPLTTVKQPAFDMGKKAAELLLSMIQKNEEEEKGTIIYKFDPEIIERES